MASATTEDAADLDGFQVSLEELRPRVLARDRSLVLVDVLSPESYRAGHIPGAISFPLADITAQSAAARLPDRAADLIVYCGGDT